MFRVYRSDNPKLGKVISREKAMKLIEKDQNAIRKGTAIFSIKDFRYNRIQTIPCKKCWACQLNYSAEWATRIVNEQGKDPNCYFITLTYDDLHLPIAEKIETKDGDYENDGTWNGTLYRKEIDRFINTLRKHFERKNYKGIKYFYAGEYGETTGRPHFHIILLHCPLDITQFYDCHVDSNFKAHWKSREIESFWADYLYNENGEKLKDENGNCIRVKKGIVDIAELEWSCAAYVARYCTKKLSYDKDKSIYYKQGKMPEWISMSKGIGFDYLKDRADEIYTNDEIIMRTVKGNVGSAKPPKAYDRKMEEWNPEFMEKLKLSRQHAAERADKLKQTLSDYTDYENLILSAEKVKKKMQMLPRVGEW